jgi:hypothetical protein
MFVKSAGEFNDSHTLPGRKILGVALIAVFDFNCSAIPCNIVVFDTLPPA